MMTKRQKTWQEQVLFRLEYEMNQALQTATTHIDPLWQERYLERHFLFIDAYIAVKEQAP